MTKGRNTTVVPIRLPDEVVSRLKTIARKKRLTMTELIRPLIVNYAVSEGKLHRLIDNGHREASVESDYEEPPDLEKASEYWKNPEPKSPVKYPETPRNTLCPCGSGLKYKRCHGK